MELRFQACGAGDLERLAAWLPEHAWPFHGRVRVDTAWVRERAAEGQFFGERVRSFWVLGSDATTLGLVRAFDLDDVTPLVDLRIGESARGRGVGSAALRWLTRTVFETSPAPRLGGYTRHDNVAMRRVFDKCGFVQEARHRAAWRLDGGGLADSVGYAVLRPDWGSGIVTPLSWP